MANGWPEGSTTTRSSSKSWAAKMSSPLSGKVTTARSSCPEASCCSSCPLDPSATFRCTWGWRTRSRSKSWGTSQRPVVPIMPSLTVPTTSSRKAVTSATMASSSFITRLARSMTTSPSSVRRPEARSTSWTSSSRSRRATWAETLDCTVPMEVAAAEKLPVSAIPISACRCFSSTPSPPQKVLAEVSFPISLTDIKYLLKLLD